VALHEQLPPKRDDKSGAWHVLRTGQPELVAEISPEQIRATTNDPDTLELLQSLGLRSYIGVPLRVRGVVRGVITFVVAETGHTYDEVDLEVAQELARRTAVALENAELYQALRQADREKDEFLATLAHELRNPLAPIRSGLHVVRLSGPRKPELDTALVMMDRQLEHLVRLVDDLLDVSRITRDKLELRLENISLADVIHSATETSEPTVRRSGTTLSVDLPGTPAFLSADRVRLSQVFSNLISNAAKYSKPNGWIRLSAEIQAGWVVVHVRDNGLGIPKEHLSTIFEMFTQVHRGTAHSQGGLGIGLTLVRRLVELHGGAVEAHSNGPGTGSEFVVRLPLGQDTHQVLHNVSREESGAFAPRRILVVDDNADAARTLETMLALMGHELRVSLNGTEAISTARQFRPDLVLLDIGLPDLSGYDVCRALRADQSTRDARIVAVTGWGKDADRQRSREAGFDDHLVKPVSVEQLEALIVSDTRDSEASGS
jgi:signal transduction histidine kinase/ActR/RegA family two-component response regulator